MATILNLETVSTALRYRINSYDIALTISYLALTGCRDVRLLGAQFWTTNLASDSRRSPPSVRAQVLHDYGYPCNTF